MKRLFATALVWVLSTAIAFASPPPIPPTPFTSTGNSGGPSAVVITNNVTAALTGYTSTTPAALAASTYTAVVTLGKAPTKSVAGQVVTFIPATTNSAAVSLKFGSIPSQAIDLNVNGTLRALTGGELPANVPATMFNTGSVWVLQTPGNPAVTSVVGATAAAQTDFSGHTTFYNPSGGETITLPCSSTLSSAAGQAFTVPNNGGLTLALTGGCSPTDNFNFNGTQTTGNLIFPAGSAPATIITDANGNFFVGPWPMNGASASLGGGALLAGACASNTVTITGAATGMAVIATPTTYPGDGNYWYAYVSAANTVTNKVCAAISGTPTASVYNDRVSP
jgi:hypothetical protein